MNKRGRRAREGSEQRACRHIERDRDREDSGRNLEPEDWEGNRARAREGSEQRAHRLEGNQERTREKTVAVR